MRTIILLIYFSFALNAQTNESVFQKSRLVNCNGTIAKTSKDSLFLSYPDSCTRVVFDTLFNGVYVFIRTTTNKIDRIVTFKNKQLQGQQTEYYKNGQISIHGQNKNSQRVGKWTEYYDTGEISCISIYKNGKIKSQKCMDKNGKKVDNVFRCTLWVD
jgi:antitoxin component YwqK of YwqJK toxin-antitoxin module